MKQAFHVSPKENDTFEVVVVMQNKPGCFLLDPKSQFAFIGSEQQATKKAEWLNKNVLKIDDKEAAEIIFSSLSII